MASADRHSKTATLFSPIGHSLATFFPSNGEEQTTKNGEPYEARDETPDHRNPAGGERRHRGAGLLRQPRQRRPESGDGPRHPRRPRGRRSRYWHIAGGDD